MKWMVSVLLLLFLFSACKGAEEEENAAEGYHKITAEEAKKRMDEEGIILLDVRTPEEYAAEHIKNALSLPNEEIKEEQPEILPDTDAVIFVYCRTGRRSKEASEKLVELGYTKVYDFGGIVDWPYETVKEENLP